MKTVFITIPMTNEPKPLRYPKSDNAELCYDGEVCFAVNAVLANIMQKNEKVKVVCVKNDSGATSDFEKIFKNELDAINKKIGAKIEYDEVIEKFSEDRTTLHNRFKKCIALLENKCEIIADITFAQKTMVPVIFSVLTFAEKFFAAKIRYVVYGKVEFDRNTKSPKADTAELFDITSLYYLNNLTATINVKDGTSAVRLVERFFTL